MHPGDRAATCRALMRPVRLLYEKGRFAILHQCTGCGRMRRCRTADDDHIDTLLE